VSQLEPRIEAIRKEYGLEASDFWQIKQNKQWVCKHSALEIIAVKAKVEWFPPQIIESNAPALVTSMVVTGKMGDRVEWSTGETNPSNYHVSGKQPSYPWAMSEKRAKDRVILKLVGIHGLVYSEDEAEDFKAPSDQANPAPPKGETTQADRFSKEDSRKTYADIQKAIDSAKTLDELKETWISLQPVIKTLPKDWESEITSRKDQCKRTLEKNRGLAQITSPNFDNLQSGDPLDEILQSQGEQE
jgi:hypothetical protein